jgi:hypothetical protein
VRDRPVSIAGHVQIASSELNRLQELTTRCFNSYICDAVQNKHACNGAVQTCPVTTFLAADAAGKHVLLHRPADLCSTVTENLSDC